MADTVQCHAQRACDKILTQGGADIVAGNFRFICQNQFNRFIDAGGGMITNNSLIGTSFAFIGGKIVSGFTQQLEFV